MVQAPRLAVLGKSHQGSRLLQIEPHQGTKTHRYFALVVSPEPARHYSNGILTKKLTHRHNPSKQ